MPQNGFLVFQAHPFRAGIRQCDERYIDGIEIYNGKTQKARNEKAEAWAKRSGKLMCSGSDFHTKAHTARGGIITKVPIKSNSDLLNVLKSQDFEIIKTY